MIMWRRGVGGCVHPLCEVNVFLPCLLFMIPLICIVEQLLVNEFGIQYSVVQNTEVTVY